MSLHNGQNQKPVYKVGNGNLKVMKLHVVFSFNEETLYLVFFKLLKEGAHLVCSLMK